MGFGFRVLGCSPARSWDPKPQMSKQNRADCSVDDTLVAGMGLGCMAQRASTERSWELGGAGGEKPKV